MLIEAVSCPIRYTWPKGAIELIPGQPVDVSEERGAKILKRCGAKIRIVTPLTIGGLIEFRSPLFGLCTGRVLSLEVESIRIGEHSVTKEIVTIPQGWVTRTIIEAQIGKEEGS